MQSVSDLNPKTGEKPKETAYSPAGTKISETEFDNGKPDKYLVFSGDKTTTYLSDKKTKHSQYDASSRKLTHFLESGKPAYESQYRKDGTQERFSWLNAEGIVPVQTTHYGADGKTPLSREHFDSDGGLKYTDTLRSDGTNKCAEPRTKTEKSLRLFSTLRKDPSGFLSDEVVLYFCTGKVDIDRRRFATNAIFREALVSRPLTAR